MKEQFACEHSHQHDWMGENEGKGARQERACVHHPKWKEGKGCALDSCLLPPKTGGRPEGRTPSVTELEREAAITSSQGGLDEGQGTRSYVASPEKRKLRSRDR
ncbi:hypothetical protein AMTRI_Chr02g266760 [Amborella trichopoda]